MSDVHDSLVAALATAQAEFPVIKKSKTAKVPTKAGGEYSYSYADLADVLSAVRPVLAKHGIAVVQPVDIVDGQTVLITRLLWGTETLEGAMPLPLEGAQPQTVGSLLTYYRRYGLCSLVGVVAEDDDDGQQAQGVSHTRLSANKADATPSQLKFLSKLMNELVPGKEKQFSQAVLGEVVTDLDANKQQASLLIDALNLAKKGAWPDGFVAAPSGLHIDDGTEPF